VPWKTASSDPSSPYANLSGIETFENGDEVSHIKIPLPQQPRDLDEDAFNITLAQPKSAEAVLGEIGQCAVKIANDIRKNPCEMFKY